MVPGNAVVAAQVALGLVPEILDFFDVVALIDEGLGVVDPFVPELRGVESVVAGEAAGADDAVGLDSLSDDWQQRGLLGIRDD